MTVLRQPFIWRSSRHKEICKTDPVHTVYCTCVSVSVLQFRSRRSSARRAWRDRCVTASVRTPLCTHTLAWQPDTHSWSWTEPAYVILAKNWTSVLAHQRSMFPVVLYFINDLIKTVFKNVMFPAPLPPQSFGLMCIQLACYHGVKVLTTSHSPQEQTFLEQLRPSVGEYRPTLWCPLQ